MSCNFRDWKELSQSLEARANPELTQFFLIFDNLNQIHCQRRKRGAIKLLIGLFEDFKKKNI